MTDYSVEIYFTKVNTIGIAEHIRSYGFPYDEEWAFAYTGGFMLKDVLRARFEELVAAFPQITAATWRRYDMFERVASTNGTIYLGFFDAVSAVKEPKDGDVIEKDGVVLARFHGDEGVWRVRYPDGRMVTRLEYVRLEIPDLTDDEIKYHSITNRMSYPCAKPDSLISSIRKIRREVLILNWYYANEKALGLNMKGGVPASVAQGIANRVYRAHLQDPENLAEYVRVANAEMEDWQYID